MEIGEEATVVAVPAASSGPAASTPAVVIAAASSLDEDLREASALGDLDRVAELLSAGAAVGSANRVNGWTALHWAAKRGHIQTVSLLLSRGADPLVKNLSGQTAANVTSCEKIAHLLSDGRSSGTGGELTVVKGNRGSPIVQVVQGRRSAPAAASTSATVGEAPGFVPGYLRHPEFPYAKPRRRAGEGSKSDRERQHPPAGQQSPRPLLLLARVANAADEDFIEVELADPCYEALLDLLCQELNLEPDSVERIRKLPNVRLRNDRDVGRLEYGQQLELVLRHF